MHAARGGTHFEPGGETSSSFWQSFLHASMSFAAGDDSPDLHFPSPGAAVVLVVGSLGLGAPPHAIAAPSSAAHADERKSLRQENRMALS